VEDQPSHHPLTPDRRPLNLTKSLPPSHASSFEK
jgi:hypothetical protein